jgi:hypothetical protein
MDDESWANFLDDDEDYDSTPSARDIAQQDAYLLHLQEKFRKAA